MEKRRLQAEVEAAGSFEVGRSKLRFGGTASAGCGVGRSHSTGNGMV